MSKNKILEIIKENSNFLISGHINPDGDCIGASNGLALALQSLGKNVKIINERVPFMYEFLHTKALAIKNSSDWKEKSYVFIAVDCGDEKRLGDHQKFLETADVSINIDHHTRNSLFADVNYVREDKSSTCEILSEVISDLNVELTKEIAQPLFAGIVYDTGSFRHSNTTVETYEVAAKLKETGIDSTKIINQLFFQKTYKSLKMLGTSLSNMDIFANGRVCIATMSGEEMDEHGGTAADLDGVIQYMIQIDTCEVAAFIYEKNYHEIKVSFRSKNYVDVAEIARSFQGGGHVRAAGCSMFGSIEDAKSKVLEALMNNF